MLRIWLAGNLVSEEEKAKKRKREKEQKTAAPARDKDVVAPPFPRSKEKKDSDV